MKRPSLASGRVQATEQPSLHAPGVVISQGPSATTRVSRLVKVLVTAGLLVAVVAVAVYTVIGATVVSPLPAGDDTVAVVRSAYPVGGVPHDALVYATVNPQPRDTVAKAQQVFTGVPGGMVVSVIGVPGDVVRSAQGNDVIMLNDHATAVTGRVEPQILQRDYLAECVTGACGTPGDVVLVPVDNVIGDVTATVTTVPPSWSEPPVVPSRQGQ